MTDVFYNDCSDYLATHASFAVFHLNSIEVCLHWFIFQVLIENTGNFPGDQASPSKPAFQLEESAWFHLIQSGTKCSSCMIIPGDAPGEVVGYFLMLHSTLFPGQTQTLLQLQPVHHLIHKTRKFAIDFRAKLRHLLLVINVKNKVQLPDWETVNDRESSRK